MADFRFFSGRISPKRELEEGQGSGLEYKSNSGAMVELTKDELADLCLYYRAYILRRLWERDRASSHYRWVAENTLRANVLKNLINGYRDAARQHASTQAYKGLLAEGMITEFVLETPDVPGKPPTRVRLTHRGTAWLMAYDRWFMNMKGAPYLREPEYHQIVDSEGFDKAESTKARPVKALKKIDFA